MLRLWIEDVRVEITTAEQDKEKRMKRTEDSLRDLWDNIKHTNIQIIWVPEEEEKKWKKPLEEQFSEGSPPPETVGEREEQNTKHSNTTEKCQWVYSR